MVPDKQWTSRERVLAAIGHRESDRVPIDLGSTTSSGIAAPALYQLRCRLGMEERRIKVYDLMQMLGEVETDLIERFHIDVLPVHMPAFHFGIRLENYKPWRLFDGTPVLVPNGFNVDIDEDGSWLLHQKGDPKAPIVAKMPKDGYYFDDLKLIGMSDEIERPPLDILEEQFLLTEEEVEFMTKRASFLRKETDKALIVSCAYKSALGMIGSMANHLALIALNKGYVKEFLHKKQEIIVENLKLLWEALGEDVDIYRTAYDFGGQEGELFSPADFEELYLPQLRRLFSWIHDNTTWKTFLHSCGSISNILPFLVDADLDIINPVQTSARGMDPEWLKAHFGDRITFWGGGIDTQKTLPFAKPDEVKKEAEKRIEIFAPGGGFVFCPVHNIQPGVPNDNIIAAFETAYHQGQYPVART